MAIAYTTAAKAADDRFEVKHSEFIGYIRPVSTEAEALEFIKTIREMHRKAKHNVYAYILRENNTTRYSDDGEPSGTAAVPVLDVLQKEGLTDVCCVVTRYFGGILLGGGGLVRAYSHSAKLAVDAAGKVDFHDCVKIKITADYSLYGKISYAFSDFKIKIIDSSFTDKVEITLIIDSEEQDRLIEQITESTNGQAACTVFEKAFEIL